MNYPYYVVLIPPKFLFRPILHKDFNDLVQIALHSSSNNYSFAIDFLLALQLFEQHVTSSQQRSHFFLHVNGRPHTTQSFSGRSDLLGFFSFFFPPPPPPPLPLRPNNRHVPPFVEDCTWLWWCCGDVVGCSDDLDLRSSAVLEGMMKAEDVQPMAQPDAMHKAMINLAGLGMIMPVCW